MASQISINGQVTRFLTVPYGQPLTLANTDLTDVTSQTWEIKPAEDFDPSDPKAAIETDPATNWAGWTYAALTKTLTLEQLGPFPDVAGEPDIPGHWRIELTVQRPGQQPEVVTAVVEVLGAYDDRTPPAYSETVEETDHAGWAFGVNRHLVMDRRRQGWVRVYNGTGGQLAVGTVCRLATPVDFRTVAGAANPGGAGTREGLVYSLELGAANAANAVWAKHVRLKAAIDDDAYGWAQLWGMDQADLTDFGAGDPVYLDNAGGLADAPPAGAESIVVGTVLTAGAAGVLFFDGMGGQGGGLGGAIGENQVAVGDANGDITGNDWLKVTPATKSLRLGETTTIPLGSIGGSNLVELSIVGPGGGSRTRINLARTSSQVAEVGDISAWGWQSGAGVQKEIVRQQFRRTGAGVDDLAGGEWSLWVKRQADAVPGQVIYCDDNFNVRLGPGSIASNDPDGYVQITGMAGLPGVAPNVGNNAITIGSDRDLWLYSSGAWQHANESDHTRLALINTSTTLNLAVGSYIVTAAPTTITLTGTNGGARGNNGKRWMILNEAAAAVPITNETPGSKINGVDQDILLQPGQAAIAMFYTIGGGGSDINHRVIPVGNVFSATGGITEGQVAYGGPGGVLTSDALAKRTATGFVVKAHAGNADPAAYQTAVIYGQDNVAAASNSVALSLVKGLNGRSALDLSLQGSQGEFLARIFEQGTSPTAGDTPAAYFSYGAHFAIRKWVTISGSTSGAGENYRINPPNLDPTMLGIWSDVNGPAIVVRGNTTGGSHLKMLDRNANQVWHTTEYGHTAIGGHNPAYQLDVAQSGTADGTRGIALGQHNNGVHAALFNYRKSRGTRAAPAAVASGDNGGLFFFQHHDGTAYRSTGFFGTRVIGAPVNNASVPTAMYFGVQDIGNTDPYSVGKVLELVDAGSGRFARFYQNDGVTEAVRVSSVGQVLSNKAWDVAAPGFSKLGDENTGWGFPASDTQAWVTGGTERMRLDSTPYGLSYTTPATIGTAGGIRIFAADNAGAQLLLTASTTHNAALSVFGSTATNTKFGVPQANTAFFETGGAVTGGFYLGTNTTAPLAFATNILERGRFAPDGGFQLVNSSAAAGVAGRAVFRYDTVTEKAQLNNNNTGWVALGTIGGSIADNQIAVGAATANQIEGGAGLTWDGADMVVGGRINAADGDAVSPGFRFSSDPNTGLSRPAVDTLWAIVGGVAQLELTTTQLKVNAAGNASAPAIARASAANTGLFWDGSDLAVSTAGGERVRFLAAGGILIQEGTDPGTPPADDYHLWVSGGALLGRGDSGTIRTIGPADPHCPACGADFMSEFSNPEYGYLALCLKCLGDEFGDRPWIVRTRPEKGAHGCAAA